MSITIGIGNFAFQGAFENTPKPKSPIQVTIFSGVANFWGQGLQLQTKIALSRRKYKNIKVKENIYFLFLCDFL